MTKQGQSSQEWCAGLPLVNERQLTPEERDELTDDAAMRSRSRAILNWIYVGIILCIPVVGAVASLQNNVLPALVLIALILLPLKIVLTRDRAKQAKSIVRDLKSGAVKCFSGTVETNLSDPILEELGLRLMLPTDGAPLTIELLTPSGRLWTVQGERFRPWILSETVRVAELPESSSISKEWLRNVEELGDDLESLNLRDLSEVEKTELRSLAMKSWRRFLILAIVLTTWFSISLGFEVAGSHPNHPELTVEIQLYFLGIITILTDAALVVTFAKSRRFVRDARRGIVFLVRVFDHEGSPLSPPIQKIYEILPHSRMVWSIDDGPAKWRRIAR
jgi:hypothetical protein